MERANIALEVLECAQDAGDELVIAACQAVLDESPDHPDQRAWRIVAEFHAALTEGA